MISTKFRKIEENLLKMISLMAESQNLLRYIKYLSNSPLELSYYDENTNTTIQQPNLDFTLIEDGNLILTPFDPTVLEKIKLKIFFNPLDSNFNDEAIAENIYSFDIVCPIQHWVVKGQGQLRPYRIADELAQLIDDKDVAGVGKVKITRQRRERYTDDYSIVSLIIRVKNSARSNK